MEKIKVMIAGLPGKMATLVAEHVEEAEDMELMSFALSELERRLQIGKISVHCIPFQLAKNRMKKVFPGVVVDFTLPRSVNWNVEFYCDHGTPFVLGTTGGDMDLLIKAVKNSSISAVIAPNMAKQIVAFQAMMEYAAVNFPDVFKEYGLRVTESHQKGKADTSATAEVIVRCFNKLGIPFKKDEITMIRDPDEQLAKLKVPKKYLNSHGWHTYIIQSKDGTVLFKFTHNVCGRDVYAQGALDAIRFLAKRKEEQGKVFSMIDVLKAYD